jgi:hypothetical protein
MSTIPTSFKMDKDTEITFTATKRASWYMHFRAFGAFNSKDPESINAVNYIADFSKAELFLFREVCRHTEENSRLTLRPKSYTTAEQARLKVAIPLWIEKGLLIRIKREYYMVNPWFLIPPKQEQVKAMDDWKALKP